MATLVYESWHFCLIYEYIHGNFLIFLSTQKQCFWHDIFVMANADTIQILLCCNIDDFYILDIEMYQTAFCLCVTDSGVLCFF